LAQDFKRSNMNLAPSSALSGLLKTNIAEMLREQIMTGTLAPGERIIEAKWANRFGVAQASIREAINILAQDGFISKESGRSARVIRLSEGDVADLYDLRGVIEGLAARNAAAGNPNLATLQASVHQMREASEAGDRQKLLDADLQFHLELCRLSQNPYVIEQARRILLPFFAFVRMRVTTSGQETKVWEKGLESHQRIVDLLREGEPEVAEHYVKRVMARFGKTAYDVWEGRS
jgi:DNA-binding GntR family transcriptional regulator